MAKQGESAVHRTGRQAGTAAFFGRRPLIWAAIVLAVAASFVVSARAASPVSAPIEQLYAALPLVMRAGRATPFRQRYDMLAPVIDRSFDLEQILRTSVGPNWATLPAPQQAALRDAFRRYTVATYAANFDSYSGQRFEIEPAMTAVGADQIVHTRIVPASGEPHRLDYVMRQTGPTWKVVDVLADGSVSRVAAQRSEVRSVFASGGGPALLARLQSKTAELSGGQPLP